MIQEEKSLLLKELCARLPYEVHLFTNSKHHIRLLTISHDIDYNEQYWINGLYDVDEVKPYLRQMSSMTEDERKEYELLANHCIVTSIGFIHLEVAPLIDWLNAHHFDFRNLIERGLAIEVTKDNNPYKS